MDECCNVSLTTDVSLLRKSLRWCKTCDEWEVALPELNVGVCGHVDELIDPEDFALYSTDVTGYVTPGWECCDRWSPRHD